MNKLFTKIVGVALGLTMAIGVGVAVASNSKEVTPKSFKEDKKESKQPTPKSTASKKEEAKPVEGYTQTTEFELVTSTNQLVAGANYIMGATYSNNNYFVARDSNNNNRKLVTSTISNNKVVLGSKIMPLTLGGEEGAWTFHTNEYAGTAGYFNATNTTGSNYLKIVEALDNYAYFSIAI